jgi:SPP1 gp7 family putative phage head morphogenesis protein
MLDRTGKRLRWTLARAAESAYNSRLRQVAREVDKLVRGMAPDGRVADPAPLVQILNDYAALLRPWAASVANYMLADVSRRNLLAWKEQSREMSRALYAEVAHAPTGAAYKELMRLNVDLIQSIPRKAAERVHNLVTEARIGGRRHEEVAAAILESGRVSASKATLIARTEASRAAVTLTQARAQFVGSQGYLWRTAHDADVRPEHKEMEGVYVRWDRPPVTDMPNGYHAGCGPNCRCFPEPVLPDH